MTESIDITKVIKGSTSDVSLDALTKKGVRQVKVVNQATITRLISEIIDRVLSERKEEITSKERQKVADAARTQFDALSKKQAAKTGELQQANQSLTNEITTLKQSLARTRELEVDNARLTAEVARLQAEVGRLGAGAPKADANANAVAQLLSLVGSQLQKASPAASNADADVLKALSTLTEKIEKMPAGVAGGRNIADVPDEVAIEFLINRDDDMETNLTSVGVKQKTAGDVKGALDRLKELQKGGE